MLLWCYLQNPKHRYSQRSSTESPQIMVVTGNMLVPYGTAHAGTVCPVKMGGDARIKERKSSCKVQQCSSSEGLLGPDKTQSLDVRSSHDNFTFRDLHCIYAAYSM